jgi:hypothetical protein
VNDEILSAIADNLVGEFPYVSLYVLSAVDVGVLASHQPLARPHLHRRMTQASVRRMLAPMGIDEPSLLSILEVFQTPQLRALAMNNVHPAHSVEFPWIGHAAGKARFLRQSWSLHDSTAKGFLGRHLGVDRQRVADFGAWMSAHAASLEPWCDPTSERYAAPFICGVLKPRAEHYLQATQPTTATSCKAKLEAYGILRDQGFLEQDLPMLAEAYAVLRETSTLLSTDAFREAAGMLVTEYGLEEQWAAAMGAIDEFERLGAFSPEDAEQLRDHTKGHHEALRLQRERLNPVG